MTGLWPLLHKEVLEQRRSRKFLALVAVFLVVAALPNIIAFGVSQAQGEFRDGAMAQAMAIVYISTVGTFLGPLLAILVMMGSLASERESGTAAMTLHKPVTRLAFITAKIIGFTTAIFAAVALSAGVAYLLALLFFGDGGIIGFAAASGVIIGYLMFLGSIALFWSALLRSATAAGGLALATWIVLNILQVIPDAGRYLPVSTPGWAQSLMLAGGTSDRWPAFLVAMGLTAALSVGAWAVFQRQEL